MFAVNVSAQIATIVMQSPPVNALSKAWLAEFLRIIDGLTARNDWKVLHLRSDQKSFCAGADLEEVGARFAAADGPHQTYAYVCHHPAAVHAHRSAATGDACRNRRGGT